jgi:predicted DsbA family dithiol-disulfide isomerase
MRLQKALSTYRSANPNSKASFTLKLAPYQLYPDSSPEGQDRHEWYKNTRYNGDEETVLKYEHYMGALARAEGVDLDFSTGTIANTLHAHRILFWVQENESEDAACRALECLYQQYFSQGCHPSAKETLLKACRAAEMGDEEAERLVEDQREGLSEVKMAIMDQAGNDVDSVPYVVFEGRRRDFTSVGAKEVGEYVKLMEGVAKEV